MNRNRMLLLTICTAVILVLTGCTSTPNPIDPNGRAAALSGTVVDEDSGLKLWSGTVEIPGVAKTNIKDGTFAFENLPYGTYTLKISNRFYETRSISVVLNRSGVTVNVEMKTKFSDSELDLLARLVHAEAKGEPYVGQVAVAASVLNRLLHPDYPNTIHDVIYQVVTANGKRYYQYEPVQNGSIKSPAGKNAVLAVKDAIAGWDPSYGATGFFAPAKVGSSSWVRTRPVTVNIGNHRFFK
ncbi:MAG: hypothetical protein GX205_01730 [Firmicutes bacterium]|jgi:hypothetical protein|nr:hypothetical protein [Bacillota bacterium]